MTTINYRSSKNRPAFFAAGGTLYQLAAAIVTYSEAWSRRQAARHIEAMPFDMRKDFGWPAADIGKATEE